METTRELHQRYLQALQTQGDSVPPYSPQKAINRLWLSMFLMMIGLLALFWLFFIEPLKPKKGTLPDRDKRTPEPPMDRQVQPREEQELAGQPLGPDRRGLNGHVFKANTEEDGEPPEDRGL